MDRKYNRKTRTWKRLVIFVFLFVCSYISAEEFTGQIIIEKTSFQINEEFKFTILIPEISPSKLIVEEPIFPDGIETIKGPSIRPGRNGSIIDYIFKANKTGRYIINSFEIKSGRSIMHTTPVFITVASTFQIHGSFDQVPPAIRWDIPEEKYYPGEIIPLRFVIENIENPDLIIESEVSQRTEGYVKKISRKSEKNERTVITKKVMTGEIYDVLFHDHIFVSFKAGNITLPNVEIFLSDGDMGYRAILKGVPIIISSLPKYEKDTGALGSYSYKYEISDNKISDLQAVILKQKITGTGNFYGITMPMPYSSNPEIVNISLIKDKYDVAPDSKLFKGSRELIYSIGKTRTEIGMFGSSKEEYPKNITVTIPDFTWYTENSFRTLSGMELERSQGAVIFLTIEENLYKSPLSDNQTDKEKKIREILLKIFKIILLISIVPAFFFLIKKKIKKPIIILIIAITLIVIILFFILTKTFVKEPVYGIIGDSAYPLNIYVIPEESAAVKFTVEKGENVEIIGEKEQFYLIETSGNGSKGWIKKENIILE